MPLQEMLDHPIQSWITYFLSANFHSIEMIRNCTSLTKLEREPS
jgi:hypothetical protein